MEERITGVMIYYYFVCKRKLWYFIHEISMEAENENVMLGKLLDENSYQRGEKHINIDNVINIDFIKEHKELHEVKKKNLMVELSQEDEAQIERIMGDIHAMKEQMLPPEFSKGKICAKCAYYDLCVI